MPMVGSKYWSQVEFFIVWKRMNRNPQFGEPISPFCNS